MITLHTLSKIPIDLIAALDTIAEANHNMEPYEIRAEVGCVFQRAARSVGWRFRRDIWPALRSALIASEQDTMKYIEHLTEYCETPKEASK